MSGETNLTKLLATMKPFLNTGNYVYCTLGEDATFDWKRPVGLFREKEGITVIIDQSYADELHLDYSFVASWITLTVHSSLEAAGLTAAFSRALAEEQISCNVVAAYYHDHIFVPQKDVVRAMDALTRLAKGHYPRATED